MRELFTDNNTFFVVFLSILGECLDANLQICFEWHPFYYFINVSTALLTPNVTENLQLIQRYLTTNLQAFSSLYYISVKSKLTKQVSVAVPL